MASHIIAFDANAASAELNRVRRIIGREFRTVTEAQLPPAHVDMNSNPVARIREMRRRGEDIMEIAVEAGAAALKDRDHRQFQIGDLAREVQKKYGENTLGAYCKRIGAVYNTVMEWRRVSEFWDDENTARQYFLDNGLSYTHLREARRLKTVRTFNEITDIVESWLTAGEDGLPITPDEAKIRVDKMLGKDVPPTKLFDGVGRVIEVVGAESSRPRVILELEPGADYGQLLKIASMYGRLIVTEPEGEKAVSESADDAPQAPF